MRENTVAERLQLVREDISLGLEAAQLALNAPTRELFYRHMNLARGTYCSAERYVDGLPLSPTEREEIEAGMTMLWAAIELWVERLRQESGR